MFTVYRIDKVDTYGNSHGVNRDETWSLEKDKTFNSEEEATEYVIAMNRRFCSYDLGIIGASDELISLRCTGRKWCHKQRYFLEKPDIKLIRKKLEDSGIKTLSA